MRELVSEVDAEIRDIRGVGESHSKLPEATRLPSLLGRRCCEPGRGGEGVSRFPSIFGYRGANENRYYEDVGRLARKSGIFTRLSAGAEWIRTFSSALDRQRFRGFFRVRAR